ncbi:hypothetical protein LTS09_017491 [Friedmanniomyces endolithicus]|nr:hypothetical protein LTS09_017491 [Friedmanniomyces endolithicus]
MCRKLRDLHRRELRHYPGRNDLRTTLNERKLAIKTIRFTEQTRIFESEPKESKIAVNPETSNSPTEKEENEAMEGSEHTTMSTNTQEDTLRPTHRPNIVIVPGAWHFGSKHFKLLTERLQAAGYNVNPLDMPSTGDNPPLTGWKDDTRTLRRPSNLPPTEAETSC